MHSIIEQSSSMENIQKILAAVTSCSQRSSTKFVAIDGLGGSGKSTLTKKLTELEPTIKVVSLDAFPHLLAEHPYHPTGVQTRVNLDRLQNEVLIPLTEGGEVKFCGTFWWPTDQKPVSYTFQPGGIVLLEGCYSFHKDIRHFFDFSIWVECAPDEALERAIARDGETGRSLWEKAHAPNEYRYVTSHEPQKYVDLIVSNTANKDFEITTKHA